MKRVETIAIPLVIFALYASTVAFNFYFQHTILRTGQEQDIIERVFGGLRGFIGDWAFMKAEEYHHRGLPFLKAMAYHVDESPLSAEKHHHEYEEGSEGREAPKDLFSRIYAAVKVTEDSHLKPAEEKEALPWFYVEVAFDPHDIRGYVLGGYWLERMNKFDESMRFMSEGLKHNPDSASLSAALGNLLFKTGKLTDAVRYLERARALWKAKGSSYAAQGRYSASERYFALDLLGSIYEREKEYAKALEIYKEVYALQPSDRLLEKMQKIATLL